MSEKIDKLYFKALRAVVKERRASGGGKFKTTDDRGVAKLHAKWAAESPIYRAIEEKRKLALPSPEEIKRKSFKYMLKESVRSYRQGWQRKKVAPEHRQNLLEHARVVSEKGEHLPWKTSEAIREARLQRRNVAVARLGPNWYTVGRVAGNKDDGDPYFIGPGLGYDVSRIIVFADSESDAYEIAQDKYPKWMFSEIISNAKFKKIEKENPHETERYTPIDGKWGIPEEDIRILEKASEFYRNAKPLEKGNLYRLPDGRIIEAR